MEVCYILSIVTLPHSPIAIMKAALLHVDGYRPYDDHILFMKAPTLLEPESDASHVQNQLGDGDEKGGTVSVCVCVCLCVRSRGMQGSAWV